MPPCCAASKFTETVGVEEAATDNAADKINVGMWDSTHRDSGGGTSTAGHHTAKSSDVHERNPGLPSSKEPRLADAPPKWQMSGDSAPACPHSGGVGTETAVPVQSSQLNSTQDQLASESDESLLDVPTSTQGPSRGRGAVRRSLGHEEAAPPSITISPPPPQSRFERRVTRGQRDIAQVEGKVPEKEGTKAKHGTRGPSTSKSSAKRHKQG